MKHYINKDGDVLVSGEIPNNGEFFEIPYFDYNFCLTVINQVGLFLYCKARYLASFEQYETIGSGIIENLKKLGVTQPIIEYSFSNLNELKAPLLKYDYFFLTSIYCNNSNKFRFLRPFVLKAEYIDECKNNWKSSNIENFIDQLVKDGFIYFE